MSRSPFVKTGTKRLDLRGDWEGEWVEVKEHLSVAEQKRIDGSAFTSIKTASSDLSSPEEAEAQVDLGKLYMTQLKVYIVGWSFKDEGGRAVDVSPSAIDALDPECADEITERLTEWKKQRDAEKQSNPNSKTSSAQRSA